MILSEKHIPSCKFEYTIKQWNSNFSCTAIKEFLEAVNEWGQEGWEVVQVFTTVEEKSILGRGLSNFNKSPIKEGNF